MTVVEETRETILAAGKHALLDVGYAGLTTRRIADLAGVPLSQIHYHFGSRQNLILAVLADENRKLLERQTALYRADMPMSEQWDQACDFLEDDLRSGYVRVLQEMTAAGWSNAEIAAAVRANLAGWFELLTETVATAEAEGVDFTPFAAGELAALAGTAFLGAEAMILLGFEEAELPCRAALRRIGDILRTAEAARR